MMTKLLVNDRNVQDWAFPSLSPSHRGFVSQKEAQVIRTDGAVCCQPKAPTLCWFHKLFPWKWGLSLLSSEGKQRGHSPVFDFWPQECKGLAGTRTWGWNQLSCFCLVQCLLAFQGLGFSARHKWKKWPLPLGEGAKISTGKNSGLFI